jgi:hypothetical protein
MTFKIFVTPLASIDLEDIVAYLAISNSDVVRVTIGLSHLLE